MNPLPLPPVAPPRRRFSSLYPFPGFNLPVSVLLLATAFPASPARAAAFVVESFAYGASAASIHGIAATGTGLSGGYSAAGGGGATQTYVPAGLDFTRNFFPTSGGALQLSLTSADSAQGGLIVGVKIAASPGVSSIYQSMLFRMDSNGMSGAYDGIGTRISSAQVTGSVVRMGMFADGVNSANHPEIRYNGSPGNAASALPVGPTCLMIAKWTNVNNAGGGTASLWVLDAAGYEAWRAAGGEEAALSTHALATATQSGAAQNTFDAATTYLQFYINEGLSGSPTGTLAGTFDEVRFGTSLADVAIPEETVGGGTLASPATGPSPEYGIGGPGFTLVKNWNFGSGPGNTIRNYADLNTHFTYHNQNGVTGPQIGYGAEAVAPTQSLAWAGQPVEYLDTAGPVREFFAETMKTYLVPLDGATTVTPALHNVGGGSFFAKWKLDAGGSLLNQDILWQTRVRYVPPKQFWFSIWTAGTQWSSNGGPEVDLIESYDYDNGSGSLNGDGHRWHSAVSNGNTIDYSSWPVGMAAAGITSYDASQWRTWTWLLRADNTTKTYVDGIEVQRGTLPWRVGGTHAGIPTDMHFLFDAAWGHTAIANANLSMPASVFDGKYFEWDYSRVYLRGASPSLAPLDNVTATITGSWTATTAAGEGKYYGANYLTDGNSGKGSKSVRYTPVIPATGGYEVYAMWHGTTGGNRATNVPYTITHADGVATVIKDQNQPTISSGYRYAQWNLLGTYTFNAGTSGNVLVSNTGTTNTVIADAIYFVPVPKTEVVVDNYDSTATFVKTGTWTTRTDNPGQFHKGNYMDDQNAGKGAKTARFTPNLPSAGTYKVYAMWSGPGTGRATNVPFTITHASGSSVVVKNQNTGCGQWNLLGTYAFNAGTGGNVLITTTGTDGYVVADAVRFVKE